jgi:hypothetical protein
MLAVVQFTVDGLAHTAAQALGIDLGRLADTLLVIAVLVVWASLPDPAPAARDAVVGAPRAVPVRSRTGS